jgi:predicted patatin/cPLA2 family phospholipase
METGNKTGLVLEGGGLRALFSEGVFDVMLTNGITFDGMIGVSAGASIGCNFKSRQIGRGLRYNVNFAKDPNYIGLRTWLKTGDIVSKDYCYHTIPTRFDIVDNDTYHSNPIAFYLVCTDVDTGEAVYKEIPDLDYEGLEWMRASSSMPIVSRPVCLDGRRLLDGGVVNSIPLKYFQSLGYGKNIVILTQPKGYKKTRTRLIPLFKVCCRHYPKITEAMSHRHEMYNRQLDYIADEEKKGNALVICPDDTLPIGRLEMKPKKMKNVYDIGLSAGKKRLDEIKDFLSHA